MSNNLPAPRGVVSGKATIRDKDGKPKGELVFSGETDLTPEEFLARLKSVGDSDVSDPRNSSA